MKANSDYFSNVMSESITWIKNCLLSSIEHTVPVFVSVYYLHFFSILIFFFINDIDSAFWIKHTRELHDQSFLQSFSISDEQSLCLCFNTDSSSLLTDCEDPMKTSRQQRLIYVRLTSAMKTKIQYKRSYLIYKRVKHTPRYCCLSTSYLPHITVVTVDDLYVFLLTLILVL